MSELVQQVGLRRPTSVHLSQPQAKPVCRSTHVACRNRPWQGIPRAEEELVDLFDCLFKSVRCVGHAIQPLLRSLTGWD